MHLWWLIFKRKEWEELYLKPCHTKTSEEWYAIGNPNMLIGTVYSSLAIFCFILYIPFMIVMARWDYLQFSCYKFMFLISIIDLVAVLCDGLVTGVQSMTGAFYCTNPTFFFIVNSISSYCWYGVTLSCILLALNRFLEMCLPSMARFMFEGRRTYFWLSLPVLYMVFFGVSFVYSTKRYIFYTDPFAETELGNNPVFKAPMFHIVHNMAVPVLLGGIYGSMVIIIKMTLQAVCICFEMFVASLVYVYNVFFPLPNAIEIFASICLIGVHGDTPIVYLVLNKTLRKSVFKLVGDFAKHSTNRPTRMNSVGVTSQVVTGDQTMRNP